MNELPTAQQMVTWAMGIRIEDGAAEGFTVDELVGGQELSDHEVAQLWLSMQHYRRAASAAEKALADEMASRMAERESGLEVNGEWVMYKARKTKRVVDVEGFWEWMREHPESMASAFNPNSVRKTGIPPAVFDTFFEMVETGSPVLSSVPLEVLEAQKGAKNE
jgi:hypothetical protein